ncbi:MAG: polysaccharide biosynthesis protein [Ramlibacter sp.]|nr:polysaccharide biosynthesis protein [Ramlibacter sp.]
MLTLGGHGLGQLVRLCGNLVLTRLLVPEAFGVMLIANATWLVVTLASDLGFRQVIVRSPRAAEREFLDTVWTLKLLQGVLVAVLLLLSAVAISGAGSTKLIPAASTLADPELPRVIAWLGLAALLGATESTKLATAMRELQLARLVAIDLGSQLLGLAVTITFALAGAGVASLVAGTCAAAACRAAGSHVLLPGTYDRLHLDPRACREVLAFGLPVLLTSCAGCIVANGDKLILGWVLGASSLGAYAIAVLLISPFHDLLSKMLGQVAYPALSRVYASDAAALRRAYLRMRGVTDLGCVVTAGLLATCGDTVVRVLYDDRYAEAGTFLCVLAISLLGIRYRLLSYVFLVIGRPRLMLYEQAAHMLALFVGVLVGFRAFGTLGAVWGVALAYLVAQLWNGWVLQRRLGLFSLALECRSLAIFAVVLAAGSLLRRLA